MKGASVKKLFWFLSGNDPICHSQKFQPSQTPPSHFLPISPRILTNIRCRYFSLNIWVVYDQLELDWCIFDQNWAKNRPLHFQRFQNIHSFDRRLVHCNVIQLLSVDNTWVVSRLSWSPHLGWTQRLVAWFMLIILWGRWCIDVCSCCQDDIVTQAFYFKACLIVQT